LFDDTDCLAGEAEALALMELSLLGGVELGAVRGVPDYVTQSLHSRTKRDHLGIV
jgi:hypothetical protein